MGPGFLNLTGFGFAGFFGTGFNFDAFYLDLNIYALAFLEAARFETINTIRYL